MGREIESRQFSPEDFVRFERRLREETDALASWVKAGRLDGAGFVAGFELEACLLDRHFLPVAGNDSFLERMAHPYVVPELSKYNIELNGTPQPLAGQGLRRLEEEFLATWRRCFEVAHELESTLVMIGILPTLRNADLTLDKMSKLNRYFALNEQVLKLRGGRPLRLHISGREELELTKSDVMLEAATTSFQVHLQVPAAEVSRHYNASIVLSAPMTALAANSPYLFGRSLWDETRIPVFEQAVDTGDDAHPERRRVTFGSGYLGEDVLEYFRENVERFGMLLPIRFEDGERRLRHLRLQNGTIWRWNRLLVGFDEREEPSLRIEHRVMPAGPTIADMIANAAVYFGAARFLAGLKVGPEANLPFDVARENFYRAARDGLDARLVWLDGNEVDARTLIGDEILHMAREGLILLDVDRDDAHRYLDLVRARVRTGTNGAVWQREQMARNGGDSLKLTAEYLARQRSEMPVHEWTA